MQNLRGEGRDKQKSIMVFSKVAYGINRLNRLLDKCMQQGFLPGDI